MVLLAWAAFGLLSTLRLGVEARAKPVSDVSKRFGDFHIMVIANPGNSCADVGEGEMCACRSARFLHCVLILLSPSARPAVQQDVPDDDPDNVFFGYCGPDLICVSLSSGICVFCRVLLYVDRSFRIGIKRRYLSCKADKAGETCLLAQVFLLTLF